MTPAQRQQIDQFREGLHESTTVLAIGLHDGHPAVHTRNAIYGQEWLWVRKKQRFDPIMLDDHFLSA